MNKVSVGEIVDFLNNNKVAGYNQILVEGSIHFLLDKGNHKISFTNCIFYGPVHISITKYAGAEIDFSNTVFKDHVYISIKVGSVVIKAAFAFFENGFEIDDPIQKLQFDCSGATLQGEFSMEKCKFQVLNFSNTMTTEIGCRIVAKETIIDSHNFNDTKLGEVDFSKAIFHNEAKFDRAEIESLICQESQFKGPAYFNHSKFSNGAYFNGAQFQDVFVGPHINNDKLVSSSVGDFSGCLFCRNTYFDFGHWDSFICSRSTFQQPVSFHLTKIREVDFTGTFFQSISDFSKTSYQKATTETFRIIKSELQKTQDRVGYLYYQSQELNQYERTSLKWDKIFLEWFMLVLNRLSTNHGINWGRGIFFSFCVMVFFYTIYIITIPGREFHWGWKGFDSFLTASDYVIKIFFLFIAIFRDFSFIEGTEPNAFSYFIDFFGRIFIGYGIYQTIQAFRKYGKG